VWQTIKTPVAMALIIAIAMTAFALSYVSNQAAQPQEAAQTSSEAAKTAYLKSIGEQNAALRRARLQDFLKEYPLDTRRRAAQAQLDLMNAYETRDWNYITKIAYEDGLSHEERLNVVDNYSQHWGGDLLGGRGKDIEDLRARITDLPDRVPTPDRRLDDRQSPISQNITSDRLLGEPRRRQAIITAPPPITRAPIAPPRPADQIIAPTVRRNVTPRYPRKALRRKVDALVVLRLNIDARGRVGLTELVEVQAPRYQKAFIKAAERAALKTRFHPQTVNGEAVPVSGIMKRYRFRSGE